MRQQTQFLGIFLALAAVGCNMTNPLSAKSKSNTPPTNTPASSMNAAPSEFSTAKKLKDPVKARLAYASWQEQAENFKEAREAYLKVLEKNSKQVDAMLGLARIDRACGRETEADAQLQKTLKCHPKDPTVLLAIGQVHLERGELKEALEKLEAAHELSPYEKIYEYHLAVIEARLGNIDQALSHFSRSVGKAEAQYNIGYILKEQGHPDEAEAYFLQALKLKPDLKKAETALIALRSDQGDEVQPASFHRK